MAVDPDGSVSGTEELVGGLIQDGNEEDLPAEIRELLKKEASDDLEDDPDEGEEQIDEDEMIQADVRATAEEMTHPETPSAGSLIQENDRYEMGYNPEEYDPHDDPRYDPRYMDDEYLMEMDAAAHGDGSGEEDGEDNDEDDSEDSHGDDEEDNDDEESISHSKSQGFAAGR